MPKFNRKKMERGVALLLEGLNLPLTDPDFKDTPGRVARMYMEMFKPGRLREHEVSFPASYKEMIVLRNHRVVTVCPHHLLPVELIVTVGYIPQDKVLGLSKLARVAEHPLTRPLKQEEFTDLVMQKLYQLCAPLGAGVRVVGNHGCMKFRGVRTRGDVVTQRLRGQFILNPTVRSEFMALTKEDACE